MYNNIFSNIKKGTTLTTYANHFKNTTSLDYKEILTNLYINEGKSKLAIAQLLGTSEGVIMSHTKKYDIKREQLQNSDNVMTKTPSMIEKETGRKFIDIYNELFNQGLSLTEICMKLEIRNISTVSTYLTMHNRRVEDIANPISESDLLIKGLKGKSPATVEKMFKQHLNIEYKEWLIQNYINKGMSQREISKLIGLSIDSISDAVRRYGIVKTKSQSRQEAMKRGTINYDDIQRKSRKTRLKNNSRSNKQDLLITLLKSNLELTFKEFDNIEIVVGYNEYCILGNLEIDIPIIIIKDNKLYKIALEYDGDIWHKERETDIDKIKMLKEKNWILFRIEETNSESSNLGILETKLKSVISQIIDYIF